MDFLGAKGKNKLKLNYWNHKPFTGGVFILERIFYIVSWLATISLAVLVIFRTILFTEIQWVSEVDIILIIFILIDYTILTGALSKQKSKNEKIWFWILIIALFFTIIWEIGLKDFPSIGIYKFNISQYYFIIVLGLLSLKLVREKISKYFSSIKKANENIENQVAKEKFFESKRVSKFARKYTAINKIPVVNNIAKFFYKQGKYYSIGIIVAVVLLIILSLPLSGRFLNGDEFHLYNVAQGIVETNQCTIAWNFLQDAPGYIYPNDCTISSIISIFFVIFGSSLFSAKVPFLIFSIVNVFLLYYLGKKLLNKGIAFTLIIFYCTNPFFVYHAGYIRVYALLITLSLLIFIFVLKLFEKYKEIKYKNNIIELTAILLLLFIGYKLRITFAPLVVGTLFLIAIKTIQFAKNKILRKYLYYALLASSLIIFLFVNQYKSSSISFYHFTGKFDWHTFNISLLNFNPKIAIITFLLFAVICLSVLHQKRKMKMNKYSSSSYLKNIGYLLILLIVINIIYGLFIEQYNMIPRYAIYLVLLNYIIMIPAIFIILSPLVKKRYINTVLLIIILVTNVSLWTTDKFNDNLGSKYNFIDMYSTNSSTSPTRSKEQYEIMYDIILKRIDPGDKKVAIVTALFNDPQLLSLKKYKDKIDIIGIGDYSLGYKFDDIDYKYPYRKIIVERRNYELHENGQRHPIKKEVLQNLKNEYDKIFITWPTRKTYKHLTVLQYVEELDFTHISGMGMDQSNIEVYYYEE